MCQKIPYETKQEAQKNARIIKAGQKFRSKSHKSKKANGKLYAYFCFHCDKWHLSSQRQR